MASMQVWTPQDIEAETLAGYQSAGNPPTIPPMADWQIYRLNAWNKAVVLGGKHYEEWRALFIAPIEAGWRGNGARHSLARHQMDPRLFPASDTAACAQSPPPETAPRSR